MNIYDHDKKSRRLKSGNNDITSCSSDVPRDGKYRNILHNTNYFKVQLPVIHEYNKEPSSNFIVRSPFRNHSFVLLRPYHFNLGLCRPHSLTSNHVQCKLNMCLGILVITRG